VDFQGSLEYELITSSDQGLPVYLLQCWWQIQANQACYLVINSSPPSTTSQIVIPISERLFISIAYKPVNVTMKVVAIGRRLKTHWFAECYSAMELVDRRFVISARGLRKTVASGADIAPRHAAGLSLSIRSLAKISVRK